MNSPAIDSQDYYREFLINSIRKTLEQIEKDKSEPRNFLRPVVVPYLYVLSDHDIRGTIHVKKMESLIKERLRGNIVPSRLVCCAREKPKTSESAEVKRI